MTPYRKGSNFQTCKLTVKKKKSWTENPAETVFQSSEAAGWENVSPGSAPRIWYNCGSWMTDSLLSYRNTCSVIHVVLILKIWKTQEWESYRVFLQCFKEQLRPGNVFQGWSPYKEALRGYWVKLWIWSLSCNRQEVGDTRSMEWMSRKVAGAAWSYRKAMCAAGRTRT